MKRGILVLSLFLISVLVISGCEQISTRVNGCRVDMAVEYLINNPNTDINEIKETLSSRNYGCKRLAERSIPTHPWEVIEHTMTFRDEDLDNAIGCAKDEYSLEDDGFTGEEFCLDDGSTANFEGYDIWGECVDHDEGGDDHGHSLCLDGIVTIDDVTAIANIIEDPCFLGKGDINLDANLNILDVVVLVNHLTEVDSLYTEFQLCAADMNSDDNFNILDVIELVNTLMSDSYYDDPIQNRDNAEVYLSWTTSSWYDTCGIMPVKAYLSNPTDYPIGGFSLDICTNQEYNSEGNYEPGIEIDAPSWVFTEVKDGSFGEIEGSVAPPCTCDYGFFDDNYCTRVFAFFDVSLAEEDYIEPGETDVELFTLFFQNDEFPLDYVSYSLDIDIDGMITNEETNHLEVIFQDLQEDVSCGDLGFCMTNNQDDCSEFDLNGDGFVNILDAVLFTPGSSTKSYSKMTDITGSESTRDGEVINMSIQSISSNSGAGTLEIYVESIEDIGGFQFSLTGLYISGASGGLATSSGFLFSTGCDGECVIAFSFSGSSIPTSSMPGVLVEISYSDHYGGEVCFKPGEGDNGPYNIISDRSAISLSTNWIDGCGGEGISGCNDPDACNYNSDATIPDGSCEYAEDNFDCDGNCLEDTDCAGTCGGSAYEDDCGTCDVYPSNDCIWGCTVDTACNYDADATDDDGSCNYAEENYDCEGNCVEEVDCNGECGGSAVLDDCGICDDDSSNDCVVDCAGALGGDAVFDNCGVCDGISEDMCGSCEFAYLWDNCYSIEDTIGLELVAVGLTGEIPPEIGQLTNLEILNLGENQLTGEIPSEIGQLTNLEKLYLYNNYGLTGEIPPEIGQLTNLLELKVTSNQLTGEIPSEIGNLVNLEILNLYNNYGLTGEIPPEIGNLVNLETLGIGYTHITGDIPSEIWDLTNLKNLMLGNADLTGEISPEIGQLTKLITVDLHGNDLTGEIPSEIGQLVNLWTLSLHSNQLTGEIPLEIWEITNLRDLWLQYNQLTGEIPPEIGQLTKLGGLMLNDNQLTGEIPPEIGNLDMDGPPVTYLRLSDNQLTGEIPSEICFDGPPQYWLHNNYLCPPYPECGEGPITSEEVQDTSNCDSKSNTNGDDGLMQKIFNFFKEIFN